MGNQRAGQLMRELCRLAGYAKNKLLSWWSWLNLLGRMMFVAAFA